jgi:hypothetical protein
MCSASFVEWATLMRDVLIAAVIFYEVEEHRASTFLADLQGAEFYKDRARCRINCSHSTAKRNACFSSASFNPILLLRRIGVPQS